MVNVESLKVSTSSDDYRRNVENGGTISIPNPTSTFPWTHSFTNFYHVYVMYSTL